MEFLSDEQVDAIIAADEAAWAQEQELEALRAALLSRGDDALA
jgi:hypothetical protein